jgi:conjugal transfer ATP-binding protein TraC
MKDSEHEVFDIYVIPPNFIDTGTVLGGMFKLRYAVEAAIILAALGLPAFQLPLPLTGQIIVVCVTALPLTLLALIGISGESLFSFITNFARYCASRRMLYRSDQSPAPRQRRWRSLGQRIAAKQKSPVPAPKRKERTHHAAKQAKRPPAQQTRKAKSTPGRSAPH